MAIDITNSQGTKVYLVATGTDVSDADAIATALASAKQVGCVQDIGELTSTRNVQEYSCLSSDETAKSLGSLKLGNLKIGMLFDSKDTAGQSEFRTMYNTNTKRICILALNDQVTPVTGNPTYFTFEAGVSSMGTSITKDNAVLSNATVEIASVPVMVAKS